MAERREEFEIKSVEGLSERKEKGRGCYGAVYEVRVHGVPCIAKRLHDILVGRRGEEPVGEKQRAGVIQKFRDEVNLLSGLRHPNVVQFLGVHYGRDEADISLIMEYMHMDLEHCITAYPNIPLPYKTSILRDVSYGLAYLHSKSIIHRDLNAGNVLLTEYLRAKIADLGVAKLFDWINTVYQKTTVCPGAPDFMPPESVDESPEYDYKLDIFSVGHLILYLVNQSVPIVSDKTMTEDDFKRKQLQVGKRRKALNQMGGPSHPLYNIAVRCLSDSPDQRPTTMQLVNCMIEICKHFPLPHKNALEIQLEQSRQSDELEKITMAVTAKKKEIQAMFKRVEAKIQTLDTDKKQLNQENTCLLYKNAQLSKEKAQLRQEKTSILMELSDYKKHMDNERNTNTQLKSSNVVLRSRLEEALSWVKLLQDNCNTLKEELERKEVYCESLKKKVEQSSEQGKLTDQVKASKQVRQAPTPRPRSRYLSLVNFAVSQAASTNVPTMDHGRADEEERRQVEEERRVKKEEKRRQAEEERRFEEEEEERRQPEKKRKVKEEEERRRAEEERRRVKEEEEERRRAEEERKRFEEEEEERRQAEEERRRVEEEEEKRQAEERRRVEEEKRPAEEERKKVEEERRQAEEERRKVEEEEKRQAGEERRRVEEEEKRRAEEERRRVEEEERRQAEEERRRVEEEEKRQAEEERKKVEEERRQAEEERRRVEEEERIQSEEDIRVKEEERRRTEEDRRVEEGKRRQAEEKRKRDDEEKMERIKAEEEERKGEEEKRKVEEKKGADEEERRRAEADCISQPLQDASSTGKSFIQHRDAADVLSETVKQLQTESEHESSFSTTHAAQAGKSSIIPCHAQQQQINTDMGEVELSAGSQLKVSNSVLQRGRDINASTPGETRKKLTAGADSELAKKLEIRRQQSESEPQDTDKMGTSPAHHSRQSSTTGESSELAKKLEIRLQRSESAPQDTDKMGTSPAHHSQQPLTTGAESSELAKKLEIRLQRSESVPQDTDKMGSPQHHSQQLLTTVLTASSSKCEIVKETYGDVKLNRVNSYEDASKEEERRRLENTSAATTILTAKMPPPPVKSKPSRPRHDHSVSETITWPQAMGTDKPTMIADESRIKPVRNNFDDSMLSTQAELSCKAATLPRQTQHQRISAGQSDKGLTDSTLKGSNSASQGVRPCSMEVEKKQEKRNLEQSNAQSKEIDNNTLLHHSKRPLAAKEKHPSLKHNVNKKSY